MSKFEVCVYVMVDASDPDAAIEKLRGSMGSLVASGDVLAYQTEACEPESEES